MNDFFADNDWVNFSEIVEKEKIDLDKLSKMAYDDPSTNSNPKKLTVADMKTLYQHSITGELF